MRRQVLSLDKIKIVIQAKQWIADLQRLNWYSIKVKCNVQLASMKCLKEYMCNVEGIYSMVVYWLTNTQKGDLPFKKQQLSVDITFHAEHSGKKLGELTTWLHRHRRLVLAWLK